MPVSSAVEFIRTLLGNLYKLCPYFFHPFDTYISSKNWFVSYTVLVYIEGISTGRDFIRKWEQQGSLSFTMVQRYLRVTISYCWSPSPFFAGCQQSNDSSSGSLPIAKTHQVFWTITEIRDQYQSKRSVNDRIK